MKAIYSETLASAAASSTAAGFDVADVLTHYVSEYWQGVTASEVLTLKTTAAGAQAIGIFATNATALVCTIKNAAGDTTYFTQNIAISSGRAWVEYDRTGEILTIELALSGSAPVTCGCVKAGLIRSFRDPKTDLNFQMRDTSLVFETADGGMIVLDRPKYRRYTFSLVLNTSTHRPWLTALYLSYGKTPVAVRLFNALDAHEYCGLWQMESPPKDSFKWPGHVLTSMQLREVI